MVLEVCFPNLINNQADTSEREHTQWLSLGHVFRGVGALSPCSPWTHDAFPIGNMGGGRAPPMEL